MVKLRAMTRCKQFFSALSIFVVIVIKFFSQLRVSFRLVRWSICRCSFFGFLSFRYFDLCFRCWDVQFFVKLHFLSFCNFGISILSLVICRWSFNFLRHKIWNLFLSVSVFCFLPWFPLQCFCLSAQRSLKPFFLFLKKVLQVQCSSWFFYHKCSVIYVRLFLAHPNICFS